MKNKKLKFKPRVPEFLLQPSFICAIGNPVQHHAAVEKLTTEVIPVIGEIPMDLLQKYISVQFTFGFAFKVSHPPITGGAAIFLRERSKGWNDICQWRFGLDESQETLLDRILFSIFTTPTSEGVFPELFDQKELRKIFAQKLGMSTIKEQLTQNATRLSTKWQDIMEMRSALEDLQRKSGLDIHPITVGMTGDPGM